MNLDHKIIKLLTKALNMTPNSPKQLKIRKEIEILIERKKQKTQKIEKSYN